MPSRFVLQPNGLLARFSTIVDNFTHANLTKEQAIDVAREDMGRADAEAKVERGLKDEIAAGKYGDGTYRWGEACRIVKDIHGEKALKEILMEISAELPRSAKLI